MHCWPYAVLASKRMLVFLKLSKITVHHDSLLAAAREGVKTATSYISSFSYALPRLPPRGCMLLLVLKVTDKMCFLLHAAQRQTSGLTDCADPFSWVCNAGRRSPSTTKPRGRPPQQRNDHDLRTRRKSRLRPGKLQLKPRIQSAAVSNCFIFCVLTTSLSVPRSGNAGRLVAACLRNFKICNVSECEAGVPIKETFTTITSAVTPRRVAQLVGTPSCSATFLSCTRQVGEKNRSRTRTWPYG